jgi:hypothetical protein
MFMILTNLDLVDQSLVKMMIWQIDFSHLGDEVD